MIRPEAKKIEELFSGSIQYEIPLYQRGFEWKQSEASDLIEDLEAYPGETSNDSLYLGAVIFDRSREAEKKIIVVDGQQRLTTILVLLIACRDHAKNIGKLELAQELQRSISFIDRSTASSTGPKLIASAVIRELFEYMSASSWTGDFPEKINKKQVKLQARRLKPIYDYFRSVLAPKGQPELSAFISAIYNAYVVRIEIEQQAEAFSIFERTNARGLDLEASDLIKNYLFARQVENIEEIWQSIVENSAGSIIRMLRYFYISNWGSVLKSKLYKKLKEKAGKVGSDHLVKDIAEFADFYEKIRNATKEGLKDYFNENGLHSIASNTERMDQVYFSISALKLFKVLQIYPIIYAAIKSYIRAINNGRNVDSKSLVKFFKALETYHFINTCVCERIGNDVESLYADYSERFSQGDNFEDDLKEFLSALSKKVAQKDEFISRFSDISYEAKSIPVIMYIFDRINNYQTKSAADWVGIFDADSRATKKGHNIEHFYPQNPAGGISEDMKDCVDNIGNLLAISRRANSKLGNLMPVEKVVKLTNDNERDIANKWYVRQFLDDYGEAAKAWGPILIKERANKMAEESYKKVWSFGG